jgi:hypothetical protein
MTDLSKYLEGKNTNIEAVLWMLVDSTVTDKGAKLSVIHAKKAYRGCRGIDPLHY